MSAFGMPASFHVFRDSRHLAARRVGKAVAYATDQTYATCPADPLSGLRSTRHPTTSGPCVLVEPAHHVELRSDVVRRLRSGAVILLVELQQLGRHALHLQRRVVL